MNDLASNIAARERAEALVELAGAECARFWQEVARMAEEKLPPKPVAVEPFGPMSEQEAIRFEHNELAFGKHAGEEVGVIPAAYLGWLAENNFAIQLRRYVKSARFKVRQEQEEC